MQSALAQRAQIIKLIRRSLDARGYIEVETPQRVRSPGIDVHLDAFTSEERYLITSPEFHMKRLLAKGLPRIYQICHCFRKGERTRLHNPEFSLLEFYAAGLNLEGMMREVEEIVRDVANRLEKGTVNFGGISCDLKPPWTRLTVNDAFAKHAGWSPLKNYNEDRFYYDLVDKVEKHLGCGKPTILYDYPPQLATLAKIEPGNPPAAKRFEIYIAGLEIANAFEELTDPAEQRSRFERDLTKRKKLSKPPYPIDETFLSALTNLPPCSGIALGVDRLAMLLTGAQSIDEVIAFPDEEV